MIRTKRHPEPWLLIGALLCASWAWSMTSSLAPRTKLLCQIPLAIMAAAWVQVPPDLPWATPDRLPGFILVVLCLDAVQYLDDSKLAILATPALLTRKNQFAGEKEAHRPEELVW